MSHASPDTPDPRAGDATDDVDARPRRSSRAAWLVAGALVLGLGVWQRHAVENAARAIVGLETRWHPAHAPNLGGIDLERVHGPLLTAWIVAASGDDLDARNAAESAMREAIADDANVAALFDELAVLGRPGQLADKRRRKRALWLTRAWNEYLDANAVPYFLDAHIRGGPHPGYVAMAYRAVVDGGGTVGDEAHRVRVLQRVDRLNVRELYAGYASTSVDGALVIADRTEQFALDRLWPALAVGFATAHEGDDARLWASMSAAIVADAERDLTAAGLAVLRETAAARADAVAAQQAVMSRHSCGSDFILRPVPWNGFEPDALDRLERWVDDESSCPAITAAELASLRTATATMRSRPALADALPLALAELARWRVRGVAIHELRHVADDVDPDDEDDDALPCAICPKGGPLVVRAELSAYLAELAWSTAPAVAFFDLCTVAAEPDTAHGRAANILLDAGEWSCARGVPDDLTSRARGLEQRAFGRSDAIAVGDSLRDDFEIAVVDASTEPGE